MGIEGKEDKCFVDKVENTVKITNMVKVGDVIKLRSSVFEGEYQTSEWSEKYLYEDQFKYVSLRFKNLGQQGDMAKTFFGSTETVVEEIGNYDDGLPWIVDGQPLIVITDRFVIIYPEALREEEITVLSFENSNFKSFESEKCLVDNLEYFEQSYLEGIFNVMERENNKLATYRTWFYMMKQEGKWSA